ncbi:GTPase-activating protein, putative [Plasmodium sp. gorilla clade G2]|uniref:GTPase-activating protein, putative n=1 Tax=Plasmodium sp. gorilla clade G2 TaxID=880535 RepID=UPI000D20F211|nr:GTPase-activating protein, putative [Plasmodium sp. gorilla clade G2]SOV13940.1 GTPase-activating protein, putative [Plasmodium sp. gorilla clade G2]
MIVGNKFWDEEKDAPILKRNANYINRENCEYICKRAEHFYDIMLSYIKEDINVEIKEDCNDKEILRIIKLDAERTFNKEENRKLLIQVLQSIYPITNDYHQGISFISSFLLLFLEPKDVVKIITGLHKYYLPGYFKAMPKAYVRDSRVFLSILNIFHPKLYEHIKNLITPEAFVSKWFIGLNVHVLTFESLMLFFENLLKEGEIFLFKYSIALCKTLEKEIINTSDVSKLLALLRLDQKLFPNDYKVSEGQKIGEFFLNIIHTAKTIDLSNINLHKLRDEAYEQMRLEEERRKQIEMERLLTDDEIIFSDEEDFTQAEDEPESETAGVDDENEGEIKYTEDENEKKNDKNEMVVETKNVQDLKDGKDIDMKYSKNEDLKNNDNIGKVDNKEAKNIHEKNQKCSQDNINKVEVKVEVNEKREMEEY